MVIAKVRNKSTVYCVMRHDFSGRDVIVAVCADGEQADNLKDEYAQMYEDRGYSREEVYFYSTGSVFYA